MGRVGLLFLQKLLLNYSMPYYDIMLTKMLIRSKTWNLLQFPSLVRSTDLMLVQMRIRLKKPGALKNFWILIQIQLLTLIQMHNTVPRPKANSNANTVRDLVPIYIVSASYDTSAAIDDLSFHKQHKLENDFNSSFLKRWHTFYGLLGGSKRFF